MTKKTTSEKFYEERRKALKRLNKYFKVYKKQEYTMVTSKKDTRNIIAIMFGFFGFLALYSGFQIFQNSLTVDARVIISVVVGIAGFLAAYFLPR